MAKKKTSKKSSAKALLDLVVLVLTGAVFGFLALPFVEAKGTVLGVTTVAHTSGYGLLDFEANSGVATCILLTIIFASLLAVVALCKLLSDAGIIKNATCAKVCSFACVIMALAVLVMAIVVMIVVPTNCKSYSVGGFASAGNYAVWYALIINAVVSLAGFVASVFSIRK